MNNDPRLTGPADPGRRRFVLGASALLAASALPVARPLWAAAPSLGLPNSLSGNEFELSIGQQTVNFSGRERLATTINNSLPAPLLRWREGDRVRITVRNQLDSVSSLHWHGLILPSEMDGVPGLSFAGIPAGKAFTYEFDLKQSGTYWYHSHSGFQEQTGLYGPIIIEPKQKDPVAYDREHVILLSDWSDESPERIHAKLKKESHYYNFRRRTVADFFADLKQKGAKQTWRDRAMWNQMRMSDSDLADVTGYTYTFLMNGVAPARGWQGLFKPGEKVRLRIINAAAMTAFDLRIPGLKLTVVAADGQNLQAVSVDELRIAPAETYDLIVEPEQAGAYAIFAQAMDRSGYALGSLVSSPELFAAAPPMDPPAKLDHSDMGMSHGEHGADQSHSSTQSQGEHDNHQRKPDNHQQHRNHNQHDPDPHAEHRQHQQGHAQHEQHQHQADAHEQHQQHKAEQAQQEDEHAGHGEHAHGEQQREEQEHSSHGHSSHEHSSHDHSSHGHSSQENSSQQHSAHGHAAQEQTKAKLGKAGFGSTAAIQHSRSEYGPQVDMRADMPESGLDDPGIGLREHHKLGRRVLRYSDLRSLEATRDKRQPTREIQLHLTGNMERYMWSIDGIPYADAPPIELRHGERLRIVLVNDTMMVHPIHLHGMWSELETGDPDYIPRKHTVIVQPGRSISYLVTADAKGRWAFHCHLMYHMGGMMREVRVS